MKKSLSRAIAVTAVCAAGVSGALVTNPAADAAKAHPTAHAKPVPTNFGYKGDVYGAKVLVDGVELRSLKDAYAQQRCTTLANTEVRKPSIASVPVNDYVNISTLTGYTKTYHDVEAGLYGVKGIASVGDVELGATDGSTPTISLKGLQSVSNAFYDTTTGKFGHAETFKPPSLTFGHLDSIPPELQQVLDALGGLSGQVTSQVIGVIQQIQDQTGAPIEIPGLGSIGLAGVKSGNAAADHATSETYALRLETDLTGNPTVIELGRARTRIARPVPGGVFRSTAMGLDMFSGTAGDLVHLGNLGQRSIPCEGTKDGKPVTQDLATASVLGGLAVLEGIHYQFLGKQNRDGSAKGYVTSNLAKLTIDSIGLKINDIASTVHMYKPAGTTKVKRTVTTSIGSIVLNGKEIPVPKPGSPPVDLGNNNFLQYRVVKKTFFGSEVHAIVLTLGDSFMPGGSVLDLGWAAGHIMPR